jgi:large subunit ribosomal protein L3
MAKLSRPRRGSLQYWPRKRAAKFLPSVNWTPVLANAKEPGLLGFIVYKAGMATAIAKDNTEKVMTAKKQVAIPVTILEAPSMKVYSVRFYSDRKLLSEVVVSSDKELKRKLRAPKELKKLDKLPENCSDVQVIVYSLAKQTSIKKTPDIIELAIKAPDANAKLEIAKTLVGKEISIADFLKFPLIDVRGLTTGKGLVGPVKRFGLALKFHKTEKGVRRPGSLAPWHPARVTFQAPISGQLGMFTRIVYNNYVLGQGKISEKDINPKEGFKNYGKIKSSYILVKGSVQGPVKRQLIITPAFRPTKDQIRRKYELLEVVTK